jgi:hypothetical protein
MKVADLHRAHMAARVRSFIDFIAECSREDTVDAKGFLG